MKKIALFVFLIVSVHMAGAQKIGYVDTDFILEKIPEYQEAQSQLNEMSQEWQKQVDRKYDEIDRMYRDLEAEEILLTDGAKRKKKEEIIRKEREAREFQHKKFGIDGELFKERQKLVKPIQDKVFEAVKEIAKAGRYTMLLDKAGSTTLIYTNSKYNESSKVLKKLGYSAEEDK